MIITALDPGVKGGIASLEIDLAMRPILLDVITFCDNELKEQVMKIKKYVALSDEVYVENVHSMPKQGVKSTFTFGVQKGIILGIVLSLEKELYLVDPREWKKIYVKKVKNYEKLDRKKKKIAVGDIVREAVKKLKVQTKGSIDRFNDDAVGMVLTIYYHKCMQQNISNDFVRYFYDKAKRG
jgi:hypothetical protein